MGTAGALPICSRSQSNYILIAILCQCIWCPGRDSNSQSLRQWLLRPPCIPFHHLGMFLLIITTGRAGEIRTHGFADLQSTALGLSATARFGIPPRIRTLTSGFGDRYAAITLGIHYLVPPAGVEPTLANYLLHTGYKSAVLPLNYRGILNLLK